MNLNTSESNEFVNEIKKAIKQSTLSPTFTISHHQNKTPSHAHDDDNYENEGKIDPMAEEKDDEKEENEIENERNYSKEECKEIVTDIIKLSTDLDLFFWNDNNDNMTYLICKIGPRVELFPILTVSKIY